MSIRRIFNDPIHKEIVFDSGKPEELMIMELIDLPDASEYGSADDKWVRNAELFLESLLEKEKLSFQTSELSNEGIKP